MSRLATAFAAGLAAALAVLALTWLSRFVYVASDGACSGAAACATLTMMRVASLILGLGAVGSAMAGIAGVVTLAMRWRSWP